MDDSPEQSSQQISTVAEPLFLFGDVGPAFTAVLPVEGRDAVDEEQCQVGSGEQGGLQEVEGEEELGGGGAVDHQEAGQTRAQFV